MSKFYCTVCEKDVELEKGVCPKCLTDWDKIFHDAGVPDGPKPKDSDDDTRIELDPYESITKEDIRNNINFFIKIANVGTIIIMLLALVVAIAAFASDLILLLVSLGLFLFAFIFEHMVKWKAYMLYTNLNKK